MNLGRLNRHPLPVTRKYAREQEFDGDVTLFPVFNVVPDFYDFLLIARKIFDVEYIVAIPDTLDPDTADRIERDLAIDVRRTESVADVHRHVREYLVDGTDDRSTVILDVGGHCADPLSDVDTDDVLGVVEDTNFGHWKYEDGDLGIPVVSIAQAPVKALENRVVGDAVVFSLENVLRNAFELELFGTDVLVLGYGNIGSSVADALRRRQSTVHVFDINPICRVAAHIDGYATGDRVELLGRCDVIVGATGQTSLDYDDVTHLRDGCILASGTSGTAEFNLDSFHEYMTVKVTGNHWKKLESDDSTLILLNDGEPINFVDTSVSLEILDIIYPSLLAGVFQLIQDEPGAGLHEVDGKRVEEAMIAWLDTYS